MLKLAGREGALTLHTATYAQRAASLQTLLGRVPRVELGIWPTPVQHLPRLGRAHGARNLLVKRDDMSGLGLGGNKVRSLEFLLGAALAEGADTVIAGGGLQSNLCRLAAAAAAKLGLECVLVHNDERPGFYQGNMLLNHLAGARQVFAGPVGEDEREALCDSIAAQVRRDGGRPYVIRNGASTSLGALGYVRAALELYGQSVSMGLDLANVVIVGAMGGTAGGLVLGLALLGAPFRAHVISVEYPKDELARRLLELAAGALDVLERCRLPHEPHLAPASFDTAAVVWEEYLGPGYALDSDDSRAALFAAARLEGLYLEPVYTAKTLAGCLDLLECNRIERDRGCCFFHTGGSGALFGLAGRLQPQDPGHKVNSAQKRADNEGIKEG